MSKRERDLICKGQEDYERKTRSKGLINSEREKRTYERSQGSSTRYVTSFKRFSSNSLTSIFVVLETDRKGIPDTNYFGLLPSKNQINYRSEITPSLGI